MHINTQNVTEDPNGIQSRKNDEMEASLLQRDAMSGSKTMYRNIHQ